MNQPLRAMYRVFDGLSLPDVHNGYFIDASARAVSAEARGLPTRVSDAPQLHIHVFGSDGGGGLFAIDTRDGTFLERILNDVRAFVEGRENYRYMTDWGPADPLD